MKANYNVTGEDRKQMVAIISREAGMQAVYTRMPECAYVIDNMKVTKTGELLWDARTDAALIEKIMSALAAAGFTEQAAEDPETEGTEETEGTAEDSTEDEPIEGLTISLPRADFTENALANLKAMVASKQTLIKKALQADSLEILTDDEKVSFPWWNTMPTPEQVAAYSAFLTALARMAKEARRVTATERATDSEKYTFRTFLLRLGFIGADYKQTRAILMEHLSGHAAFKNQADADAFYAKLKEKKAAAKATGAETEAPETEDAAQEGESDEISE